MKTSLFAGLRFPAGLMVGLFLTASLFSVLQSLTQRQFAVVAATPVKIEFTRVQRTETVDTKRQEKPVLEERPPVVDIRPPLVGRGDTRIVAILPETQPTVGRPEQIAISGTDQDAAPIFRVNPVYPPTAAARNIEGWVQVQFNISAAGAVTDVVVVDSEPARIFDAATLTAVSRWRYNPSVVNGTAVERRGMRTVLRFNLEEE
jgi:periplasmic protein TonB